MSLKNLSAKNKIPKLFKDKLNNKRVNKVLNNVEKVIANSEFTKDLAIKKGIDPKKMIVIN